MMRYYDLVKQFVNKHFSTPKLSFQIKHFERTVDWLKHFQPNADEAFLIAAYAHDIERGFRTSGVDEDKDKKFNDDFYLIEHPAIGARVISEFLETQNAPQALIERVVMLIKGHETGGTDEQNILKDADTISFFEDKNTIDYFLFRASVKGPGTIKDKFDWMFERITSPQAKEIAKPMYQEALTQLKNIKQ